MINKLEEGMHQGTPQRFATALRQLVLRIREHVEFDSPLLKAVIGSLGLCTGLVLYLLGKERQGFSLLAKLHRSNFGTMIVAERIAKGALRQDQRSAGNLRLRQGLQNYIDKQVPAPHTRRYFEHPEKLLGTVVLVLKSPEPGGKGVVVILYSYVIPLFARLFDVQRISKDYLLVLEPSWSGLCNWDVLCYGHLEAPIFVQTYEPRDYKFIQRIESNFVPVPLSNNWWVDHRIFRPIPGAAKDVDVIMVAGWADFKRHQALFRALAKLRRKGPRLRTVLIGYPMEKSKDQVLEAAQYHGVQDQLEIYESINADEVNHHLNRAKVNVIWSRREGANRAIVEGMFAGVPCLLREGHNYGYRYPHMNAMTGGYASEEDLPDKLIWMTEHHETFSPRAWVEANMTCQKATSILMDSIRNEAATTGEPWVGNLAVKVNELHGMQYWDKTDHDRVSGDYAFLRSCARGK